jgi:hypothetical protein
LTQNHQSQKTSFCATELDFRSEIDLTRKASMDQSKSILIERAALAALANWKSLFAERTHSIAKGLAAETGNGQVLTLSHYRQAAVLAAQSLASHIQNVEVTNAYRDAA